MLPPKKPRRVRVPLFELLESRRLMSAAPTIPAGAVIHNGNGNSELSAANVTSGADAAHPNVYENYTVNTQLYVMNLSNVMITRCNVGGFSGNGIFVNNITNVSIVGNTFSGLGCGILAYPTNIVGCNFDNNTFTNVGEPIHLDFGNSGVSRNNSVSNNHLTNVERWGIEIQSVSTGGLKVLNNYVAIDPNQAAPGGCLSIATGDGQNTGAAGAPKTSGNEIANNICIGSAHTAGCCAIENYGSGTNIHDNFVKGPFSWGVLYAWTGLDGNVPWQMTNNTFVGCSSVVTNEPYGTAAQTIAPTLTNDQSFALNAANAPAVPNWSAGTPTAIAPAPTVTPTFTATPESDGVELALPAGGGTLTWTATGNTGNPLSDPTSDETNTTVIPAGTTSYVDTSVPNNWQVYYTFSGATGQSLTVFTNSAQVFSSVSANCAGSDASRDANSTDGPDNRRTNGTRTAVAVRSAGVE